MRKMLALTLALAFVLVFAVQALAKDMEGEVTAIDKDTKTVTVAKLCFDASEVNLSGIAVGDTVKVIYGVEGEKNILQSISKAEEEMFLRESIRRENYQFIMAICTLIMAICTLIGIIIALYKLTIQRKRPDLSATCELVDSSLCKIKCTITNDGSAPAKDVNLSFTFGLPVNTQIQADPVYQMEIKRVDSCPDPNIEEAHSITAFLIKVPLVPRNDDISFFLFTEEGDNLRASEQYNKIFDVEKDVIQTFGSLLYGEDLKKWNEELIISAHLKKECLYQPASLLYSSEKRIEIEFITQQERQAYHIHLELRRQYKKEFTSILENTDEYIAPVFIIEQKHGSTVVPYSSPYVRTYALETRESNGVFSVVPPKTYEEKEVIDKSNSDVFPYKVCPECGSKNLIRDTEYLAHYVETDDDGVPLYRTTCYKTIECGDCGCKKRK